MKRILLAAGAIAACLAASLTAAAQSTPSVTTAPATSTPAPLCEGELFRQFDFWVGEWEVSSPDGKFAGVNSITKEENGCLLIERWKGVQGSTGQSYNYVDLTNNTWRQIWVSPGTTIDYSGGLNKDGAMALEGTIGYPPGTPGNGAKFKGTWTPNADGSVTQHFQQYDDAKKEWTDWFIGTYTRKAK